MITELNDKDKKSNEKYAIETFDLTKIYKLNDKNILKALDNVNIKIKDKEIFGLLGPNGAGKTTLVSILTTLIRPTQGFATIYGHNILKEAWFVRENVGLMFGGEMIYLRLTGYKNLKFFSKIYGIKNYKKKILELAERFELTKWLYEYVDKYSRGMQLKLALARVLLIEPKILFLDEPLLGLDPTTTLDVIEIFKKLNITILLTSHQMDIISKLCKRIAFLNKGVIVKIDNQENFLKLISEKLNIQIKVEGNKKQLLYELNQKDFINDISSNENIISFNIINESFFPSLFEILRKFPVISFNEINPSLEEVFVKLSKF